jgi:hypothetical protein
MISTMPLDQKRSCGRVLATAFQIPPVPSRAGKRKVALGPQLPATFLLRTKVAHLSDGSKVSYRSMISTMPLDQITEISSELEHLLDLGVELEALLRQSLGDRLPDTAGSVARREAEYRSMISTMPLDQITEISSDLEPLRSTSRDLVFSPSERCATLLLASIFSTLVSNWKRSCGRVLATAFHHAP